MRSKSTLIYQRLGRWYKDHSFSCREDFIFEVGAEATLSLLQQSVQGNPILLSTVTSTEGSPLARKYLLNNPQDLLRAEFILPLSPNLKDDQKITAAKHIGRDIKKRYPLITFHVRQFYDDFTGTTIYEHHISGDGEQAWEAIAFVWWHLLGLRLLETQKNKRGDTWPHTMEEALQQSNPDNTSAWYRSSDQIGHLDLWNNFNKEVHARYWLVLGSGAIRASAEHEFAGNYWNSIVYPEIMNFLTRKES